MLGECSGEPIEGALPPYIMVELPLECGHPLRVFWRPETPCDLELHHGDDPACRTFLYDASDMTRRAQQLINHSDVQKWLSSIHPNDVG